MDDAPRSSRNTGLDWVTGGAIVAVYAAVQVALLQGPRPFDPAIYFEAGVAFPNVDANLWTLRIGLVAPVNAAVRVFGPSEAALYAVPLAAGLVLVASVYGTMLVLFRDRLLAAAAALVTGLNGYFLLNSSFIFPDTVATATFTAGFLFLLLGVVRAEERRTWMATASAVSAGVLFGWTYLIREFSPVLLLPAVLAAVVLLRYPARRLAILAGAALATVSLNVLYALWRYGDPLLHFQLLLERREKRVSRGDAPIVEHYHEQLDSLLDTTLVFPRLLVSWRVGWVFLLLVLVLAVALVRLRDRRLWIFAAWGLTFWAVMAVVGLGSLPSGRWILNITNIRYWYAIFPPLVMGAFAGASLLVGRFGPTVRGVSLAHPLTVVLAALAVVPGVAEYRSCAATGAWASDSAHNWRELRSWLGTQEAGRYDVVWTDLNTKRLVPAFTSSTFGERRWSGRVEKLFDHRTRIVGAPDPDRSVILVVKDRFRSDRSLRELRRAWGPIFVSDDRRMVVLAHHGSQTTREAGARDQPWWNLSNDPGDEADSRACRMRPYAPLT